MSAAGMQQIVLAREVLLRAAALAQEQHVSYPDAYGVFAVAACLELPEPTSIGTILAPDLPGRIQVRTRDVRPPLREKGDHLIVRFEDTQEDRFVLVTTTGPPTFCLHGWILGAHARQPRYLFPEGNGHNAWFVPPSDLEPIETLRSGTLTRRCVHGAWLWLGERCYQPDRPHRDPVGREVLRQRVPATLPVALRLRAQDRRTRRRVIICG